MASKCTVQLDDNELPNVSSVSASVSRGGTLDGRPAELCSAMTFVVTRDVFDEGDVDTFRLFANQNGRRRLFDGEIRLRDDKDRDVMTYRFERGFISSWLLSSSGGHGLTQEVLSIQSGIVRKSSNGSTSSFAHETYDQKTQD